MSVRSFRPVVAVATVAVAALSCYLVSLRVAAERAGLEGVETQIVLAQRDIRSLQTEVGTRGRLEQLERWNVKVLALSAPKAEQFVDGGYQLARLARPSDAVPMDAPVVLAAAPRPVPTPPMAAEDDNVAPHIAPRAATSNGSPASLMHVASYSLPDTHTPVAKTLAKSLAKPLVKSPAKPVTEPIAKSDATRPKKAHEFGLNVSSATKSVKLATVSGKPLLPTAATTAKVPAQRKPVKKQASAATTPKDKATN